MKFVDEEICGGCDLVIHAVFDSEELHAHRVGNIRCPECGTVNPPCNECEDNLACDDCPWKGASISKAMSDDDYDYYERTGMVRK